jgi:hypothetical protein
MSQKTVLIGFRLVIIREDILDISKAAKKQYSVGIS